MIHQNRVSPGSHVGHKEVDWIVNTDGVITSHKCTRIAETRMDSQCKPCKMLQWNRKLQNILSNAVAASNGNFPVRSNDVYTPFSELIRRRNVLQRENNSSKLLGLQQARCTALLSRRRNDLDRFMEAIQELDIVKLRTLMANHLKHSRSLNSLVQKMYSAAQVIMTANGNYRRRFITKANKDSNGFFPEEYVTHCELSWLTWKLGCGKLLHTCGVQQGSLSKTSIKRRINDGTLLLSKVLVTHGLNELGEQTIRENIWEALFSESAQKWRPKEKVMVIIMFDGVAVEPRLSLDATQLPNQVSGLCRHCCNATFATYGDFTSLVENFNADESSSSKIHAASEAEVFAIGFIGDAGHTSIIPVAVSPTCKKDAILNESTHSIQWILDVIIKIYKEYDGPKKIGPIMTLVSDGAAHFSLASGGLLDGILPSYICEVYSDCKLFNLAGGADGCTRGADLDHLGKRSRERIKSGKGVSFGMFTFEKHALTIYGCFAGIFQSENEAETILNPKDAMDVVIMVLGLQAVARFSRIPWNLYKEVFRNDASNFEIFRELRLLGHIFHCMAVLIIGHEGAYKDNDPKEPHLSLSELLTFASILSHLLFVCHRRRRTNFLPNQNYRNWQDQIKSMFVSVTMHKHHGVINYHWFLDSSKRLEQYFGILRSMRGGDLNFNVQGLKERMIDATGIARVYASHPEWDTLSRKLHSSHDRKNVRSWRGCTDTRNVNEAKCWMDGRSKALQALRASQVFLPQELDLDNMGEKIDMMRPLGVTIGVQAGDDDQEL